MVANLQPPQGAATPRSLLVGWANQQDAWIRRLVSDVVLTGKPLTDQQAADLYDVFLREKHLKAGDPVAVEKLRDDPIEAGTREPLVLKSIEDIRNVNALAADQKITFSPKITIVFGENASGKTGYVRVLKRAAAVRTAEAILPNVITTAAVTAAPAARFIYDINGQETTLEWHNEAGLAPLNRIDVFDARAALLHVDADLTYVYTPGELSRFPLVQQGIDQIRARLESDIREAGPGANPFVAHFDRASRLYATIESLGASTDVAKLRQVAAVSEEEQAQIAGLRTEIEALKSTTPQAQLRLAEAQKQHVQVLVSAMETLRQFNQAAHTDALRRYLDAKAQYERATTSSFAGTDIPGVLQDSWKRFIQAGEEYLKSTADPDAYPQHGKPCIYCRQPLGTEAIDLLLKYRDYCNGEFRAQLDRAEAQLNGITGPILGLQTDDLSRRLAEFSGTAGFITTEQLRQLEGLLADLLELKTILVGNQEYTQQELPTKVDAAVGTLATALESTTALIANLKDRSEKREQSLKERQAALLDIESRLLLTRLLPEIEEYVQRAQWVDKAKIQFRRFQGVLRSLTETSKTASEELLNRDFERRFTDECTKLRAPKVRLEFPGRQGQVTRHKAIAPDDGKLSDVLSEGEQKVIAMADFLAEIALKPSAPVVFDDPISSLDYRRISEVVNRIVQLSETRQAIVLTHNIWFTTELLAAFEKSPQDCAYYDVTRDGNQIGVISRGTHPRSDTYSSLRGKINDLIQSAGRLAGEAQAALIEKAYEYLRNICEVVAETDLLQGVTQRYQPNVRMTCLPKIKANHLHAAVAAINPVYEKCCRCIASHSQPLETLNVRPTLDELKEDWKTVQAARDAYLNGK